MKPILTMDFETDPFKHGVRVYPFACGLYDGQNFDSVWSPDCAVRMVKRLSKLLTPSIIYMHNGGRFDIFFIMQALEREMVVINGRITRAWCGIHEIRDSYAILPFALSAYKKDDIKIEKLERECRELHRVEILSYLRGDCVYLHELVTAFHAEFGDYLTIGSASMNQLMKFHGREFQMKIGAQSHDKTFRSQFFFGGRVQCFESGIIHKPFKIYDVNSMYPFVMKNFRHPMGASDIDRTVNKDTAFIVAEGRQTGPHGSLPIRNRQGGIDFTEAYGTFAMSRHEWDAAEQTKTFRPTRVIKTYGFDEWISFGEFVEHFYNARMKAKADDDKIHLLFYKLILNSAYGKFAQNPDNFQDYKITHGQRLPEPWQEHFIHNEGEYVIWKKGVERHSYYNVAIGASITGAARSVLIHALSTSNGAIYCDTDSLIVTGEFPARLEETELGAWKLEASGDRIAIAGKKLYACFDGDKCVKKATKGARISPAEIEDVARGETVTFSKDAPTFKLDGSIQWIERRIRKTV